MKSIARRKIVLSVLSAVALITTLAFVTAGHWWKELSSAKVTYNQADSSDSVVYHHPDNMLLVKLHNDNDKDSYIVLLTKPEYIAYLAKPQYEENFVAFPLGYTYAIKTGENIPAVPMIKTDVQPGLLSGPGFIEFTTAKGGRVHVSY
jgi:hypothetical protein